MIGRIWSLIFVLFRLVLVVHFFTGWQLASVVFGISELSVLFLTVNGLRRKNVDQTLSGMIVPLCYLAPLLMTPTSTPTIFSHLLIVVCFIQIGLRFTMGTNVTVGVPNFLHLCNKGPYALIRHPLSLSEFLAVFLFMITFPKFHNFVFGMTSLATCVIAVISEEKFLIQFNEYKIYKLKVRYRYIPQIW